MDIRPATPGDAHALWEAESATAALPGQLASRPEEISIVSLDARIRTASQAGCFFVAEANGRLLGHAVLEPMGLIAIQHVYRLTIVVHPGQTGLGIGTALLQHIQRWAASRPDLHKIELNVRATNASAIRLYTRLGFQEEGRFRDRIRLPTGEFIDDLAMAWFPDVAPPHASGERRPNPA
jgi:ribosomal protein S18 acetylase RimI-like enzyme